MHESNENLRHLRATEDQSHLIVETWTRLARNVLLTLLVAVTAWLFTSALMGCIDYTHSGLFDAFREGSEKSAHNVSRLLEQYFYGMPFLFIFVVLIAGGIIRDLLLRSTTWHDAEGDGVKRALALFYAAHQEQKRGTPNPNNLRYQKPTFMEAVRRIVLTFLTIGTGGSGGLEGPVIPVGEAIASGWSKWFNVASPDDLRLLQMSGISAAFATLLNAPYMSAIFAAEVVFSDRLIYRPLFYSLIAAVAAHFLNNHFLHIAPLFTFHPHAQFYPPLEYFYATLVAILISAPAALGLRFLFIKLKQLVRIVPKFLQATTGAVLTGAVAFIVWSIWQIPPEHILGVGEKTLSVVYEGGGSAQLHQWWPLLIIVLAKAVATGLTLMAGGSAGLLIPAMFMGGMSGAAVYYALLSIGVHIPVSTPEIFIVSGVASSLVAVIEVPIAAIAFVLEGFGASLAPPAITACVVCHLVVKRLRLYS